MMHDFYFNNLWLSRFGGRLLGHPKHEIAKREVDAVSIPGLSGDLLLDNKRYLNVEFERSLAFMPFLATQTAKKLAYNIIEWLTSAPGEYSIFKDTYNPGYFTKAYISDFSELERELPYLLSAKVKFNRIPFWYSDVGTRKIELLNGTAVINNPETLESEPVITYICESNKYSPVININGESITLNKPDGYTKVVVDRQKLQYIAYSSDTSGLHLPVHVSEELIPFLVPGKNVIEVSGFHEGSLTLTPNWRRL